MDEGVLHLEKLHTRGFYFWFWPREIPTGRHQRRRRFCKSRQTRVLVSTPLRRPNGQIWLPINFSNYLAYQLQLLRGDTALSSWPRYAAVGAGWRSVPNIIWNGRVKKTVYELSCEFYTELLDSSMSIFQGAILLLLLLKMNSWFQAKRGEKHGGVTWRVSLANREAVLLAVVQSSTRRSVHLLTCLR